MPVSTRLARSEHFTTVMVKHRIVSGTGDVAAEVRILRSITNNIVARNKSHPGAGSILTSLDDFIFTSPGSPVLHHQCIVTQLVLPLSNESLDLPDKAPLMRQLVDAMHFLHHQGIVHGDPHFGNIGIAVEGISHVSEQDMLKYIEDDVALVSALENIQDDESIDCHNIVPTDARKARLKLYDFGRAYAVPKDDLRGTPPRELMGDNPISHRSPEVDVYRLSGGAVGAHWSFGCDVWALGSLLFKLARPALNLVPQHGDHGTEAYRIAQRCLLGGAPPRDWLDHCDMGPAVLLYIQEQAEKNGSGGDAGARVHNRAWVLREMARLSDEFWQDKATRRRWEDPSFPLAEFCSMVRSMMVLEPSQRASMDDVVNHEFWAKYSTL